MEEVLQVEEDKDHTKEAKAEVVTEVLKEVSRYILDLLQALAKTMLCQMLDTLHLMELALDTLLHYKDMLEDEQEEIEMEEEERNKEH